MEQYYKALVDNILLSPSSMSIKNDTAISCLAPQNAENVNWNEKPSLHKLEIQIEYILL